MINWDGDVIFLSCRPYGENGVIASVFSKDFGRYKGWVFGGNSPKRKSCLQQGNYLSAQWKARIPEQMGTIKLELINRKPPSPSRLLKTVDEVIPSVIGQLLGPRPEEAYKQIEPLKERMSKLDIKGG